MSKPRNFLSRTVIVAAIVTAFAAVGVGSASAAPLLLTGNDVGGSVSVINAQTNQVVGQPIKVGEGTSSIAVTPNGRFAYVANASSNTVSVIEPAASRVVGLPIPVGEDPETVAISPDGKTVYVADAGGEEISVIDTQTNAVVADIQLGADPYGLAFAPDAPLAYVALPSEDTVAVIDTQTEKVVGEPIQVGEDPVVVTFAPDGETAYVTDYEGDEISAIDTSSHRVTSIPVGVKPWGIAVTPDGSKAFVTDYGADAVSVVDLQAKLAIKEFPVGDDPYEIAITPDGKVAYVASYLSEDVRAINTQTYKEVAPPIELAGLGPWQVAITPDQSPIAAFAVPAATATVPTTFSGVASTDPDGTIAAWNWTFGDGGTGSGSSVTHAYGAAGTYSAQLSVVDNEGCGAAEVFTGRTAYCGGGTGAAVTHTVPVTAPAPTPTSIGPSNKFGIGRTIHNRKNGTVKLQVKKLPGTGSLLLFGKKVHAVTRKVKSAGSMWLTIHARVELNKALKKIHRAKVRVRVTFTPTGGTPRTMARSITLLRAAKKKHRRAAR